MHETPKVLILDIDEELISAETKFLEEDGVTVIKSSDVSDVLGRLEEMNPDLILIGTEVPMINGDLPLTLILKVSHAPIVAIGHREELVYMLELGADRFISKPIDKSQFMATIHSLLRRYSDYSNKGSNSERISNYRNN